jgi:hypothetical protein
MTPVSDMRAIRLARRPEPSFHGPLEFLADQERREAWDRHDRRIERGDQEPGTGHPDDDTVLRFPPRLRLVTNDTSNNNGRARLHPDTAA